MSALPKMFDSLKSFDTLKASGIKEPHARAFITIIKNAHDITLETLSTKDDFQVLRNDFKLHAATNRQDMIAMESGLRQDMAAIESSLKQEISGLRQDMITMESGLRQDMTAMETSLRQDMSAIESSLKQEISGLRQDMIAMESGLRQDMTAMETSLRQDMAAIEITLKQEIAVNVSSLRKEINTLEVNLNQGLAMADAKAVAREAVLRGELSTFKTETREALSALNSKFGLLSRFLFGSILMITLNIAITLLHH